MASFVLSECGIRPYVRVYPKPKTSFVSNSKPSFKLNSPTGSFSKTRNWSLNVTTPLTTIQSPSEGHTERIDSGALPPFNLADIKAVIPQHCWVKNPWMSMSYLARDVGIVFGLAAIAAYFNNWLLWPLYWFAQGTMFWALFILGHDCGHGSFSNDPKLNSVAGHFLHTSLLVPYHGWRISHRSHHQVKNHVQDEDDQSVDHLSENKKVEKPTQIAQPFPMLANPFNLWSTIQKDSHYHPDSDLFLPEEKKDVLISSVCWAAMAALLVSLNFVMGPIQMIKLYVIPYWIMLTWLDFVSNLHHHRDEDKLPWYSGKEWSFLKEGLTALDSDYGFINKINHNIGAHVMHHLFPEIPHYHLVEATEAAKPVLGNYYTEPKNSGPLPHHLLESLIKVYFKRNEMAQEEKKDLGVAEASAME